MAKKVAEECMFCGEIPCVCGKPAKPATPPKTKAKRVPAEEREQQPKTKPSPAASKPEPTPVKKNPAILGAMRAMAKDAQKSAQETETVPAASDTAPRASGEKHSISPELASALRAMEGIMHPAEKTKYASVLRSEPTLDEKRVTLKNIRAYRKEGG